MCWACQCIVNCNEGRRVQTQKSSKLCQRNVCGWPLKKKLNCCKKKKKPLKSFVNDAVALYKEMLSSLQLNKIGP